MKLTRRHFLHGGAGITVGLPFLDMFAPRKARAAHLPKRLLLVATGFSMDVEARSPEGSFATTGNAQGIGTLPPILSPFDPYRDRMTVVSGIDNYLPDTLRTNGHHASGKTLLTAHTMKASIGADGSFKDQVVCDPSSEVAGPSVDHYLASRLDCKNLNFTIGRVSSEHRMRWQQIGGNVVFDPGVQNPQTAFDTLFGQVKPDNTEPTPLQVLRSRRASVLDTVLSEFNSLRARAGAADRIRLEEHASMVRELEMNVNKVVQIVCGNPTLQLPSSWPEIQENFRNPEGIYDDLLLQTFGQLATTAFACQATQVASVHLRNFNSASFPWLNNGNPFIPANFHAVVHHDAGTSEQRLAIYRWHAQAIKDMMDQLANTADGHDTSVLDNTLVVWVSSLSSSSHSTKNLPVALFGDLQGAVRTGQHVRYTPHRPHGDLWATVLTAMGVPTNSFGFTGTQGANGEALSVGPLTELLA